MTPDIRGLGWTLYGRDGQEPVLSAFSEPFDTWGPMDQVLPREDWPRRRRAGQRLVLLQRAADWRATRRPATTPFRRAWRRR